MSGRASPQAEEKLSGYGLAYWHMMRADFLGQQSGDVIAAARAAYRGALVGNMGYSPREAAECYRGGEARCRGVWHTVPGQSGFAGTCQGRRGVECAGCGDVLFAGA